jgi:hypothetical protein
VRRPLLVLAVILLALALASVPLFILYDDDEVAQADGSVKLGSTVLRRDC